MKPDVPFSQHPQSCPPRDVSRKTGFRLTIQRDRFLSLFSFPIIEYDHVYLMSALSVFQSNLPYAVWISDTVILTAFVSFTHTYGSHLFEQSSGVHVMLNLLRW